MKKSLHLLIACALAGLPLPSAALEVRTYTASELGFMASSHLILGRDEAILVDAQFTRSDARELVRLVEESGRTLTTVIVTHARPEHYLGLAVLAQHYPRARMTAHPRTVAAIRAGAEEEIARWRLIYAGDVPTRVVVPEPCADEVLTLDDREIRLVHLASGDPDDDLPTVLYLPGERTLLVSDLGFNDVHPWVVADPAVWREYLAQIRRLGPIERVLPGHGRGGGVELLDRVEDYMTALGDVLATDPSPADAARRMRESYPEAGLPILLEQSLKTLNRSERR